MYFRNYQNEDYQLVCDFLIKINKDDKTHINWNWARLEWMSEHPFFNKELIHYIGLWFDNDELVAVAIYDMYFGEASCLTLPEYSYLFSEVLEYAYNNLQDENGLGVAINKNSAEEIEKCMVSQFVLSEQKEIVMSFETKIVSEISLPNSFKFVEVSPEKNLDEIEWVIYQGFDNGDDKEEFERQRKPFHQRAHFNPYLNLAIENSDGEKVAYCSLWYDERTDYAYLEPLCVIPNYRHFGLGKALVLKLIERVSKMGVKKVYVISDLEFYKKIGFVISQEYSFYWKKP